MLRTKHKAKIQRRIHKEDDSNCSSTMFEQNQFIRATTSLNFTICQLRFEFSKSLLLQSYSALPKALFILHRLAIFKQIK